MDKLDQNNFREQTAEILLKLEAIKLSPNNPFTWASGWKSPVYCDNRIILSDSNARNLIADKFVKIIKDKYKDTQLIAGVATGAIGIGILVAQKLDLPFIYVRPEAKKHGRKNQIEGKVLQNQKVIVIEDLVSTGMSSLNAVKALKNSKLNVLGMIAIFTYGFEISKRNFANDKIHLDTLCDYSILLKKAVETEYISKNNLKTLSAWNRDPENWS